MSSQPRPPGEIILIDKPYGWTSFQAVKKVKWVTKSKRCGHAGTLDPLATGLLIVCTEGSTRKISELQNLEKEYTGTITLGNTTPSHDLETEPNAFFDFSHVTEAQVKAAAATFIGETEQTPPLFSAIKVDGRRAYKLAREGVAHELKPRTIIISEFEITRFAPPEIDFRVVCSKGTYIRSLAYDLSLTMGTGGHLSALRRTRIGQYNADDAVTPKDFEQLRRPVQPEG